MGRIKKNVLKYGKKELNSSVSVFLDLTEPKRNEITEIPKFTEIVLFRSSTAPHGIFPLKSNFDESSIQYLHIYVL